MKIRILHLLLWGTLLPTVSHSQERERMVDKISRGLEYEIQLQGTGSHGKTPLWLNANRHGLSSIETANGYLRASIERPLRVDSARKWGISYGADVVLPYHFTSKVIVQQAFAEGRWWHGTLTAGSKEYPMELKNNTLSSGAQTLGINARPVPQIRLALPEYWTLPFGKGWLHLKGHIAYGRMTDENWQHQFTNRTEKYADNVLFHSKAGYLKIGNEEGFFPLSLEMGLEMASTFGGTSHRKLSDGTMQTVKGGTGLKALWKAFFPGGADAPENGTAYMNAEGNQLGSWVARLNYDSDVWELSFYADKFFEDHSSMLQLDYDGYGEGAQWMAKKKRRYVLYDFKDMMLGTELRFKYDRMIQNVVFEYIYTKYQSGPIYHDHTITLPDHIGGIDNFYNHYLYTGWQHWGQVMGNPLYRSPIYNTDGSIRVTDNRFVALHLGVSGTPVERLYYRLLATYQEGWGTYADPYTKKHHNMSLLVEGQYRLPHGWNVSAAYGADFGKILGRNHGIQITVTKHGLF